jgi:hypothetical protein
VDVKRSSKATTGTEVAAASFAMKASVSRACSPWRPASVSGSPTTTRSTACSSISCTIRAMSVPPTTSSGRAMVPVGSETATPVRARP